MKIFQNLAAVAQALADFNAGALFYCSNSGSQCVSYTQGAFFVSNDTDFCIKSNFSQPEVDVDCTKANDVYVKFSAREAACFNATTSQVQEFAVADTLTIWGMWLFALALLCFAACIAMRLNRAETKL